MYLNLKFANHQKLNFAKKQFRPSCTHMTTYAYNSVSASALSLKKYSNMPQLEFLKIWQWSLKQNNESFVEMIRSWSETFCVMILNMAGWKCLNPILFSPKTLFGLKTCFTQVILMENIRAFDSLGKISPRLDNLTKIWCS